MKILRTTSLSLARKLLSAVYRETHRWDSTGLGYPSIYGGRTTRPGRAAAVADERSEYSAELKNLRAPFAACLSQGSFRCMSISFPECA